jgi:hypothetical protein
MVGFSPVEVYQVKVLYPVVFELLGRVQRVVAINYFRVVIAFGEAHALAVDDVNSWNNPHFCNE